MRIILIIAMIFIGTQLTFAQVKKATLNKFERNFTDWYLLNAKDTAEVFALDTLRFVGQSSYIDSSTTRFPNVVFIKPEFDFSVNRISPVIINNSCTSYRIDMRGKWSINKTNSTMSFAYYEPNDKIESDNLDDWSKTKELTYQIIELTENSLILVKK